MSFEIFVSIGFQFVNISIKLCLYLSTIIQEEIKAKSLVNIWIMSTEQEPGLHNKTNQTICVLCLWLQLELALVEGGGTGGTGATRLLKLKTDQPSYTHAKSRDPQNNKESSGMSKPFLLKVKVRVQDLHWSWINVCYR